MAQEPAETLTRPSAAQSAVRASEGGCNPRHRALQTLATPWGRLRAETGWSLREAAERSGINRGDLSKFERGRGCPTPDQAILLLRAYGRV